MWAGQASPSSPLASDAQPLTISRLPSECWCPPLWAATLKNSRGLFFGKLPILFTLSIYAASMPSYPNVTIIGVGLLGGSIGLALRERGLAKKIVGVGRRQSSLDQALSCGAITDSTTDLATGVAAADVVIVATPVDSVADGVLRALAAAPSTALLTDVGSTKNKICRVVSESPAESDSFVGSHPLAGDHRSGPKHARADLFADKVVVVTPTASTPPATAQRACTFWQALGAQVVSMSPDKHDQALATTSHLPHLVASALAASTPTEWLPLAATGWADTTRIAAADPKLWTQIFSDNRVDVLATLDRFIQQLQSVRGDLANEDECVLETFLQQAKRTRDALGN